MQKLKNDYDFRFNKLINHQAYERDQYKKSPQYTREGMEKLRAHHERTMNEFHGKYKKLRKDYEEMKKEQEASEAKGLR